MDKVPQVTTVHECWGEDALLALIESIPDDSCGFMVSRMSEPNKARLYKVIVLSNSPKPKTRPATPGNRPRQRKEWQ